jgi:hypothetical protein
MNFALVLTTGTITYGFSTILPNEEIIESSSHRTYIMKNSDGMPIVFDTEASMSVSPVREDFIGDLDPPTTYALHGLKGKIDVLGTGTLTWTVFDVHGVTRSITTRAHYIPEASIRLFSPQVYFNEQGGMSCLTKDKMLLALKDGTEMEFPYNSGSNIPLMLTKPPLTAGLTNDDILYLAQAHSFSLNISVADEVNQNISAAQKALLVLHWKLAHANFSWVQALCSNL